MSIHTTVSGAQRELTAAPMAVSGTMREASVVNAAISGVQREIFSGAPQMWERYSVFHYFGTLSSSITKFYDGDFEVYYGNYLESGTYPVQYVLLEEPGVYARLKNVDYYITKGYGNIYSPGEMKKVLSYVEGKGNYIDTVESKNADEYPENGVQGDYWYVKLS